MNRAEIHTLTVFSSGPCTADAVSFLRADQNIVECVFKRMGKTLTPRFKLRLYEANPVTTAVELYQGFDDFVIIDHAKKDPQREVGRFEMLIFRDEITLRFCFDSYEIEDLLSP